MVHSLVSSMIALIVILKFNNALQLSLYFILGFPNRDTKSHQQESSRRVTLRIIYCHINMGLVNLYVSYFNLFFLCHFAEYIWEYNRWKLLEGKIFPFCMQLQVEIVNDKVLEKEDRKIPLKSYVTKIETDFGPWHNPWRAILFCGIEVRSLYLTWALEVIF